ncbi:hypothetical protein IYW40_01655 [Methylocystis sp. H4A]|uniref:hypothetical protein n=1 Tax=Methylocystis sp. H4A TaxID=2785788 RepID=UPI0018C21304|nr:hypothetical protein [Methylocystis sp. H4A]MBG0800222.1 hypothetical protein [Methylocystis sp. H4A]
MSTANDNADVTPLFIEIRPGMRRALADAVEAFLNLLDQIDADADLEDADPPEDDAPCEDVGDDEPSLGSVGSRDASLPQYLRSQGADDDREDESEMLEPGGDDEPALGATTAMNQEHAWRCSAWDSSDEAEPSLGWTGHGRGHPEMALRGYDDDRERTTGPRDEEGDDAVDGELDADCMDSWLNPPHLPGGNGAMRRTGR